MSEEQPTFKVTDRRLFNPDGTPRDIPRVEEETPVTAAAPPQAETAQAETAQESASQAAPVASSGQTAQGQSGMDDALSEEQEIPGADDPASFVNFLMSLASNAAASLGMMEHPATGQRAVDLQLAKHWIDVLGMLQQKTRGNLTPQEAQIFEGLLSDLRMQFVALSRSRPAAGAPRGFTGHDITGGR